MIVLHKFVPAWGLPDMSPFCCKVEIYLRMVGLAFEGKTADARKAPKGKLPYVNDGGELISDSRDIVAHFEAKLAHPLDRGLTPRERAIATAFRALLEEELYFYALTLRWQPDENFRYYEPILTTYGRAIGIPGLLAPLVLRAVRRRLVQSAIGQGAGRHSREDIDDRLCEIVEAVAVQLGDGPFFLGERPRTIDATAYAFMWTLRSTPFETRAGALARTNPQISAYCRRMHERYFTDPTPRVSAPLASLL